ncbi:ExbD/TolR family protein [Ramlibacter humi]|uniref:Biopolymer transporter ExbD n=1 Tax=Ramlibacter humi TaxID=2530451 RepID=A0A4Z0BTN2_9BURK|nr:biopolymer transporter ExbD [Ramlibacter humi]TFZ01770.1 biopolymer transporter ExbD [Ramlibacter humi]
MPFGRLERTEGPRPMSDINVTPLVDVMLVLVVILIITAPLMASSLRLDLPKAETAKASDAPRSVVVGLESSGKVFFNDKPVDMPQLAQSLAEAARQGPDTEVQLRADQAVPYGKVVEVMAAAQKAGLSRIGFVAEPAR